MATKTTQSSNDTLVDLYIERAVDLLRLEAGTRNKVLAILADLESELVAALAKADPTGVGAVSAQRKRLTKLLDATRAAVRASYRDASKLMTSEIREIVDQEATWTGHAINTSINIDFVTGGLTRAGLETIASDVLIQGAASEDWWSRQAQDLQNRFTDQMRLGVAAGETNADLIARVRGKPGQAGVMDISENSASRLVRTSVQAAANAGREAMYDKNNDIIASLQWHATLDTRTSIWCITRDGHHYSNDDEHKPKDGGPAWLQGPGKLHWNCRSTSVPVLKSWRDLGIDMDEIPQTTRASMDGQVPAKTTFEAWLKKQSAERQDTVLGATVADLWRRGKLNFRDLLNQSGRPLTTEQLREKAARK
jgi:SPP1 gp7 family putative phage head morphogenesis protein